MSTNYYFIPSLDSPLLPYSQLHIGKSSCGWVFSFQAYDFPGGVTTAKVAAGLSVTVNVPQCILKSWDDWEEVLKFGIIEDEYGTTLTLTEFKKVLDAKTPTAGRTLNNHSDRYRTNDNWTDCYGYSFSNYEFS